MAEVAPIVAERIAFVLGYDTEGKPIELQIASAPNRTILVQPNDRVAVLSTHPVSGEPNITEYFKGKFYGWSYTPRMAPPSEEPKED